MAGKNRTQMTLPLMLLAFVGIAGFLYWMNSSTEAVRVAIAEEEAAAIAEREAERAAENEALELSPEQFVEGPENFIGEMVRLQGVPFFGQLGPEAFHVLLPTDLVYLVHYEQGATIPPGTEPIIIGRVVEMSDSVLSTWQSRGAMPNAADLEQASLSPTFIEAVDVQVPAEAPAEGDPQGN